MAELLPWLRLLMQRKRRLTIGGLLMFATLLAGTGLLALSGWFITATALTGLLIASGVSAQLNIYTPGGGIRFFALARTVSRYLERLYNHDTVLRLLADVRLALFTRLSATAPGATGGKRASDWLNRLTSDIDTLDALYLQLIAPPALALAALFLLALVLALVAPPMLWALLPLALLPVVLYLLARQTINPSRNQGYQLEALRGRFVDTMEGSAELQAAHLWSRTSDELLADSRQLDRNRLTTDNWTALANGVTLFAVHAAAVLALLLGLQLWDQGGLSGPVALLFTLAVLGVGEAFTALPVAFSRVGATLGAARRLNDDSGQPPPEHSHAPPPAQGDLRLNAMAACRNDERLFHPVSVDLPRGHRLAVVGRSGSGKSTLLDFLAGMSTATEGTVLLAGQEVAPDKSPAWRAGVSYLSQRTHFFSDSVRANLLIACPGASDGELRSVLEAVALSELLDTLPQGLDTWIGDQGRKLSGGERRRLALARSLLRPGWLLLLDEPFTGVDDATRQRICTAIEPWLENRTCILAGHATTALPQSDICIRLD